MKSKLLFCLGVVDMNRLLQEVAGRCIDSGPPQIYSLGFSINGGTPKSSISIGFSLVNHPFEGTPISGNVYIGFRLQVCTSTAKATSPSTSASRRVIQELGSLNRHLEFETLPYLGWIKTALKCYTLHILWVPRMTQFE